MNKPKLNEPDVEISLTTPQGESITINKTIPSQQFEDIFVTDMSVKDQQTIVDFKQNHGELNLREYGHIKIEPGVITYNGKIYIPIVSPTFEECVKEWNDWGYELYKGKNHIHFRQRNDYGLYDEYIFHPIQKYYVANNTKVTFERLQLIIKTLKALEVTDE